MVNLFKNLKPKKRLSKNGFDLSQKHVFSSKPGMLVPVSPVETIPDDYMEISLASLMRTQTLDTAAFIRGKQRFDFFFVPYSQIWKNFNQFITQRDDRHSSQDLGTANCPVIMLSEVLWLAFSAHYAYVRSLTDGIDGDQTVPGMNAVRDIQGFSWGAGCVRLLDMLGFGDYSYILSFTASDIAGQSARLVQIAQYIQLFKNRYVNVFRIAAYQHVWYDYYRNKIYDLPSRDEGLEEVNASGAPYNDYVKMFNFDDIQCNDFASSVIPTGIQWPVGGEYDVQDLIDSSDFATNQVIRRVVALFTLRYCQWKKDLFTASMPGQQFGSVSTVELGAGPVGLTIGQPIYGPVTNVDNVSTIEKGSDGGLAVGSYMFGNAQGNKVSTSASQPTTFNSSQDVQIRTPHTHLVEGGSSGAMSFDVLTLRKAEVLQNWKQATLRAGNKTDDQFLAHFGVTPKYYLNNEVDYLGSFDSSLQVNPVEATAAGTGVNGAVGDIAATGTAVVRGKEIKFKTHDFGVIICMGSYLPETDYRSTMMDKANTLYEQFDFFTSEFENVGLEAIHMSDYSFSQLAHQNADEGIDAVIGYAPRYWMYKQALDKIHAGFFDVHVYYEDANGIPDPSEDEVPDVYGPFSSWAAPRTEQIIGSGFARALPSFYVQPSVYDNVFGVAADSKIDTDTFIHNCYFNIKAIRPISVLGIPQF